MNQAVPNKLPQKRADIPRQTLNLWPDTGRRLGLGRNATFDAAKRGDIPTIRIGRRWLVSRQLLDKMLAGEIDSAA